MMLPEDCNVRLDLIIGNAAMQVAEVQQLFHRSPGAIAATGIYLPSPPMTTQDCTLRSYRLYTGLQLSSDVTVNEGSTCAGHSLQRGVHQLLLLHAPGSGQQSNTSGKSFPLHSLPCAHGACIFPWITHLQPTMYGMHNSAYKNKKPGKARMRVSVTGVVLNCLPLQAWLQDIAWEESGYGAALEQRAQPHTEEVREKLQQEPMFCFERAVGLSPLWTCHASRTRRKWLSCGPLLNVPAILAQALET